MNNELNDFFNRVDKPHESTGLDWFMANPMIFFFFFPKSTDLDWFLANPMKVSENPSNTCFRFDLLII